MSLPKGFKRLEYIQSSGTQYIDTDFKPTGASKIIFDFQMVNQGSTQHALFGSRPGTTGRFTVFTGTSTSALQAEYNTQSSLSKSGAAISGLNTNNRNTIELSNSLVVNGGVVNTIDAVSFTSTYNLWIFANNNQGTAQLTGSAKLYSCQAYDNGTLVRDYIPCMTDTDEVGLWDAANEEFYGNAGTGTFAAGPVVPEAVDESEITELEYIQSSGTQYFKTGFFPTSKSRVVMEFEALTAGVDVGLCGARTSNSSKAFCFWFYTNYITSARFDYSKVNPITTATPPSNERITLDMNQNTCVCDNFSETQPATTFQCDYDLALFGINTAGTVGTSTLFVGKLYNCQVYDEGLLERDFIPAMLSNGEVGLYDRVFHGFYRNAGTGEFIAGPEAATVPKAPANFRVLSKTDTQVTLAWDPSEKALGYRLYRQGQLLADTEETSVSVAVEPFAGAVFALTAYNENGEGAGTSLTHFSIPDNPLLYLITDRTQKDVAERNQKGYYAASDLNRVGYAIEYLAPIIRGYGYALEVHTKTDWTDEDWKLSGEMVKYLQSLKNLKAVFSTLVELPETMEKIDYRDANNIEQLLLTIDETIVRVVAGFTRANAYGLRSGAKSLPASQSDRGRNWGQLDAMETTWANWQLATWYLLLYGNLKAEGVVE